jgi:hypothetical protein
MGQKQMIRPNLCLDSAAAIVPAQNLEGARLAALRYLAAKASLSGNVGDAANDLALLKAEGHFK